MKIVKIDYITVLWHGIEEEEMNIQIYIQSDNHVVNYYIIIRHILIYMLMMMIDYYPKLPFESFLFVLTMKQQQLA